MEDTLKGMKVDDEEDLLSEDKVRTKVEKMTVLEDEDVIMIGADEVKPKKEKKDKKKKKVRVEVEEDVMNVDPPVKEKKVKKEKKKRSD
jgi:hypothetical protein